MQYWMLVSSADNLETSRGRGFDLAGMKSRHRKKAEKVQPGDRVLFYVTGRQAFRRPARTSRTRPRSGRARRVTCTRSAFQSNRR
jgi:hypothetical protein